jgi:hypothetical protein
MVSFVGSSGAKSSRFGLSSARSAAGFVLLEGANRSHSSVNSSPAHDAARPFFVGRLQQL